MHQASRMQVLAAASRKQRHWWRQRAEVEAALQVKAVAAAAAAALAVAGKAAVAIMGVVATMVVGGSATMMVAAAGVGVPAPVVEG